MHIESFQITLDIFNQYVFHKESSVDGPIFLYDLRLDAALV